MSLFVKLACFALRPVVRQVVNAVAKGAEFRLSEGVTNAVGNYFVTRFTDPSTQLRAALIRAGDRSWRAIEIALNGESLWSRLVDRGEDKAFRAEIRTFLDANPLELPAARGAAFRRSALKELGAARKAGLIPGDESSAAAVAKQTTDFLRFASPHDLCEAEWALTGEMAENLRGSGYRDLADLLKLRPLADQPPLLALAVRFFFRREVETNAKLFQGLVYDQVDQLGQALKSGLAGLQAALDRHGEQLLQVLGTLHDDVLAVKKDVRVVLAGVLDVQAEQARLGAGQAGLAEDLRQIYAAVASFSGKLDHLHERGLRQSDATSIQSGAERQLIKALKARFRALPESQRPRLPALLNAIGKLELAAGDYEEAQQDFRQVAAEVADQGARAAALYNAFLANLEKRDWNTALAELVEASRLDPSQFALFPLDRYEPERILGAGGFGVVFLCRNRLSKARMVVKSLRPDGLDRELTTVLHEAGALEQLQHDTIIRLRDCGWGGPNETRPYLVMDWFDGLTLDEHVVKFGKLLVPEAQVVARQMAEGLAAAHAHGILHRDVKPGNILIDRSPSGLRVKLIDFGLAMRQKAVQNTMTNASALSNTIRGQSIAGTIDFASPEQMGRIPHKAVSPRSDIYGFGRTLCFALFATAKPGRRHWEELRHQQFAELIDDCIEESPESRPESFPAVLQRLQSIADPAKEPIADAILVDPRSESRPEKEAARHLVLVNGVWMFKDDADPYQPSSMEGSARPAENQLEKELERLRAVEGERLRVARGLDGPFSLENELERLRAEEAHRVREAQALDGVVPEDVGWQQRGRGSDSRWRKEEEERRRTEEEQRRRAEEDERRWQREEEKRRRESYRTEEAIVRDVHEVDPRPANRDERIRRGVLIAQLQRLLGFFRYRLIKTLLLLAFAAVLGSSLAALGYHQARESSIPRDRPIFLGHPVEQEHQLDDLIEEQRTNLNNCENLGKWDPEDLRLRGVADRQAELSSRAWNIRNWLDSYGFDSRYQAKMQRLASKIDLGPAANSLREGRVGESMGQQKEVLAALRELKSLMEDSQMDARAMDRSYENAQLAAWIIFVGVVLVFSFLYLGWRRSVRASLMRKIIAAHPQELRSWGGEELLLNPTTLKDLIETLQEGKLTLRASR